MLVQARPFLRLSSAVFVPESELFIFLLSPRSRSDVCLDGVYLRDMRGTCTRAYMYIGRVRVLRYAAQSLPRP